MLKTTSLFLSIFLLVTNATAQQIEWKVDAEKRSKGRLITTDSEGNIFQARDGNEDNSIAKISPNGELLWEEKICDCDDDHVLISVLANQISIIHVASKGSVYLTNGEGQDRKLLYNIIPDSLELDFVNFSTAELIDDIIVVAGTLRINGAYKRVKAFCNIFSDQVNLEIETSDLSTASYRSNSNTKYTVELLQDYPDSAMVVVRDDIGNLLLGKEFSLSSMAYTDAYTTDKNNLVLVGIRLADNKRIGVIKVYDITGQLKWEYEMEAEVGRYVVFLRVAVHDSEIIIGGSKGSSDLSHDALILSMDEETGNINWELIDPTLGYGDNVEDIIILPNSEILISGSSGQTDYGGPERAYLMKVSAPVSDVVSIDKKKHNIYPNPTSQVINIDASYKVMSIALLDMQSRLITEVSGSNSIDVHLVPPGVYLLRIRSGKGITYHEVVINRI